MTPNRPGPDSPLADIVAYYNQNFDVLDDQDRTKIIRNGSTPTLLLGYQLGGFNGRDYGLKVAKPGFDVTTATNDQLAFSSAFSTLRVVSSGTTSLTAVGDGNYYTSVITHNLGYKPVVIAYANDTGDLTTLVDGTNTPMPYTMTGYSAGITVEAHAHFVVSTTTLTFSVICEPTAEGLWSFTYYLLQESAG